MGVILDSCIWVALAAQTLDVDGVPSMAGRFRWTDLADARNDELMAGGCVIPNDVDTDPRTSGHS